MQWGSEKGKVQSISADIVEAEIVSGDIGLMGGLRVVPFKCKRTCFASDLRAKIARIDKWVYYMDGGSGWTPVRAAGVLSMFWGLDRLSGFPVTHDVLEMKSEYFSMNFVIVQNA